MYDLKTMTRLAGKGKVTRRDFVQFALALGIGATAAETMFVRAVRAEPKSGGFARFGLAHGATTDTLDPGNYLDTFTQLSFWGAMSNNLCVVDSEGKIQPDLAESYEPGDGAKTWVYKLRKGLTYHDGRSVTSQDVVDSYRFHMTPDSKSAVNSLLTGALADVKTDGPDTVIFTLNTGSADFPYLTSDYHVPIMPSNGDGTVDWQSANRTGAFILEKFEPGVSVKLKRNPNYHHEGKPYFDEVEFLTLSDVTARTNAMTTGETHYMARCDFKTLDRLKANPDIEVNEESGFAHNTMPMLVDVPPFDDVNVRLALKHCIDRQEIVDKIFLGHAIAGNDNPIAASVPYAIDPEPRHSYDPDKAKYFLKQAGLSSLAVDLSVAEVAFPGALDAGVLIKNSAINCGIDVNVIREPNDGYWDNVWLKKGWSGSYTSGRPTQDWMFATFYAADASWNESHWKNPRFNELLVAARAEIDEPKRAAMYAEMQQLVHDDSGMIILVFNNWVDANSTALAHGKIGANWEGDGFRISERWWFA